MAHDYAALFPRASAYDRDWAEAHSLGENVLYFADSLLPAMPLAPGSRVLDLACGLGASSVFLARECDVEVYAVDRATDPTAIARLAESMGVGDRVHPVRADARGLPFADAWFDAVVCFDAYPYFGTDARYLPFLARHVKAGGRIGIVDTCFTTEIESPADLPDGLWDEFVDDGWTCCHSIPWWRRHWQHSGLVDVEVAEPIEGSDAIIDRELARYAGQPDELAGLRMYLEAREQVVTFRMVARRNERPVVLEDDAGPAPY